MERAKLDGFEVEYEVRGTGEPVIFVHGSHVAEAHKCLMSEPALKEFRLIRYHRRGFAGSTHPDGSLSIAEQAADCAALLRLLDVERAHVVGHSYGGAIALQLALDAPAAVQTLVLQEPALLMVPSAASFMEQLGPVLGSYGSGDKAAAVEGFLEAVSNAEYRSSIEARAPGGVDQAIKDADTFFQIEMPALENWNFTADDAKRLTQPVLYVLGGDSAAMFGEGKDLVHTLLPQTEVAIIPKATHLLQMEEPGVVADAIGEFLRRHPM